MFVTGRCGAGFHFVTPQLLRPGVNSLPFLPPRMTRGPGQAVGRGVYFTSPADCLEGPRLLVPHSCPCAEPYLFLRVIFSD